MKEQIIKNNGVLADHEPQRLNEKCLICPNQIVTAGFYYCSAHSQQIQEDYRHWKQKQDWDIIFKIKGIINKHLKTCLTKQ
ncbi:hypothetical protein [endosymbiont GvMRE of Glomus versiforme]|uniref:hypothetical protein n=1 Tax=endosymbiont GvMRE of Glomus versiforme TaxID=2039283 RepID=UPI000EB89AC2|nr:hypothetical protein [endosymbiont GvMRE of Glomus versiforme]RHZ37518.1 hypothetical protein GvMRE_I1g621 [endosymbiont GvMRE of Glomus versiforme]